MMLYLLEYFVCHIYIGYVLSATWMRSLLFKIIWSGSQPLQEFISNKNSWSTLSYGEIINHVEHRCIMSISVSVRQCVQEQVFQKQNKTLMKPMHDKTCGQDFAFWNPTSHWLSTIFHYGKKLELGLNLDINRSCLCFIPYRFLHFKYISVGRPCCSSKEST